MATGFGIAPDADGTGTTPEDIQRITAAKYQNAGVLTGAVVSRRSDWAYDVSNGAVLLDTAPDMAVEVPVTAQTLTPPTTAGGPAATHTIYVKQNMPGTDGNSLAFVGITSGTVPAGAVTLNRYDVPAGATATNAGTSTWDRRYALLSGASFGILGSHVDTNMSAHGAGDKITRGSMRFYVPTDRLLDIRLTGTVVHSNISGNLYHSELQSSLMFKIYVDNELRRSWEMTYSRFYESKQFTTVETVSAGTHTVHYTVEMQWGNPGIPPTGSYWRVAHGGSEQWPGNRIQVMDGGAVK